MLLRKEATNKDQSLKMQMLLSLDKSDSSNSVKKLEKTGFFGDQKFDFTIAKPNFSKNTLIYYNQGTVLTLKAGDYAIYLDYVILGQIILASNCPDLDNYTLKDNEVIIYVSLYNTETSHFRDIKKWLRLIMVQGDPYEIFRYYGYDTERSKILYSSFKHPLPNTFQGTSFKKHVPQLIEEKEPQDQSKLFFFLPSTTDRKEKINKFFGNVNLHPVDCPYDDFVNYANKNHLILPHHLDPS